MQKLSRSNGNGNSGFPARNDKKKATADPYGMTNKRTSNSNSNSNSNGNGSSNSKDNGSDGAASCI
jgi:hypothetical protein